LRRLQRPPRCEALCLGRPRTLGQRGDGLSPVKIFGAPAAREPHQSTLALPISWHLPLPPPLWKKGQAGKGPRAQGFKGQAGNPGGRQQTRNPTLSLESAGRKLYRQAERQLWGALNQEPPRSSLSSRPSADSSSAGSNQGRPSLGPCRGQGCQRSRHHSHTLPCMSCRPQALAGKQPTGVVCKGWGGGGGSRG